MAGTRGKSSRCNFGNMMSFFLLFLMLQFVSPSPLLHRAKKELSPTDTQQLTTATSIVATYSLANPAHNFTLLQASVTSLKSREDNPVTPNEDGTTAAKTDKTDDINEEEEDSGDAKQDADRFSPTTTTKSTADEQNNTTTVATAPESSDRQRENEDIDSSATANSTQSSLCPKKTMTAITSNTTIVFVLDEEDCRGASKNSSTPQSSQDATSSLPVDYATNSGLFTTSFEQMVTTFGSETTSLPVFTAHYDSTNSTRSMASRSTAYMTSATLTAQTTEFTPHIPTTTQNLTDLGTLSTALATSVEQNNITDFATSVATQDAKNATGLVLTQQITSSASGLLSPTKNVTALSSKSTAVAMPTASYNGTADWKSLYTTYERSTAAATSTVSHNGTADWKSVYTTYERSIEVATPTAYYNDTVSSIGLYTEYERSTASITSTSQSGRSTGNVLITASASTYEYNVTASSSLPPYEVYSITHTTAARPTHSTSNVSESGEYPSGFASSSSMPTATPEPSSVGRYNYTFTSTSSSLKNMTETMTTSGSVLTQDINSTTSTVSIVGAATRSVSSTTAVSTPVPTSAGLYNATANSTSLRSQGSISMISAATASPTDDSTIDVANTVQSLTSMIQGMTMSSATASTSKSAMPSSTALIGVMTVAPASITKTRHHETSHKSAPTYSDKKSSTSAARVSHPTKDSAHEDSSSHDDSSDDDDDDTGHLKIWTEDVHDDVNSIAGLGVLITNKGPCSSKRPCIKIKDYLKYAKRIRDQGGKVIDIAEHSIDSIIGGTIGGALGGFLGLNTPGAVSSILPVHEVSHLFKKAFEAKDILTKNNIDLSQLDGPTDLPDEKKKVGEKVKNMFRKIGKKFSKIGKKFRNMFKGNGNGGSDGGGSGDGKGNGPDNGEKGGPDLSQYTKKQRRNLQQFVDQTHMDVEKAVNWMVKYDWDYMKAVLEWKNMPGHSSTGSSEPPKLSKAQQEAVKKFRDFTNMNEQDAIDWLKREHWEVDQAIQDWMENGNDGDNSPPKQTPTKKGPPKQTSTKKEPSKQTDTKKDPPQKTNPEDLSKENKMKLERFKKAYKLSEAEARKWLEKANWDSETAAYEYALDQSKNDNGGPGKNGYDSDDEISESGQEPPEEPDTEVSRLTEKLWRKTFPDGKWQVISTPGMNVLCIL